MKKILCPTDFSSTASNAVDFAAKLARQFQGSLTLLNVTPVEVTAGDERIQHAKQSLTTLRDQVSKTFNIPCSYLVESKNANLIEGISEQTSGFDLIVMGSNGPDDVYQFFAGSNTYNTIRETKIPLLMVPVGVGYKEMKSLVYAFDYMKEKTLPLKGLKPFLDATRSTPVVLQVITDAHSHESADERALLEGNVKKSSGNFDYEFDAVHSNDVADGIDAYMSAKRADVLALCSVERSAFERFFHKSVIRKISADCKYPLYVFHQ